MIDSIILALSFFFSLNSRMILNVIIMKGCTHYTRHAESMASTEKEKTHYISQRDGSISLRNTIIQRLYGAIYSSQQVRGNLAIFTIECK